jgi:hypothetical protein
LIDGQREKTDRLEKELKVTIRDLYKRWRERVRRRRLTDSFTIFGERRFGT